MTSARHELVVSTTTGLHLDFLDLETFESTGRIDDLILQPHEMAFDPTRRVLYLTHTYRSGGYGEGQEKAHELSVIDVDTKQVVDVIDLSPHQGPHDVEYDPVKDLVYTGVERVDGRNGIVVVDPATRSVVDAIGLDAPNAHWLTVTPDGSTAFVSHKEADHVSVVDLESRKHVASVPVPHGTEEIDCSPDGRFVYVATPIMKVQVNVSQGALNRIPPEPGDPPTRLLKIDVATREVVGETAFEGVVCAVRVGPDGLVLVSEMHFPDRDATDPEPVPGRVHAIDGRSMERIFELETGELPFTIRFTPDGARAFVANLKTGTVTVVDVAGQRVERVVDHHLDGPLGGTHGMAVVPVEST